MDAEKIKVLVIPVDGPVRQEFIVADEAEEGLSRIIFGPGVTDGPVGYAGFGRTMLAFDEIAGDRDNVGQNANPRANELWNHLAAQRQLPAFVYATDDEPVYGTFVAMGHGLGSRTDDDTLTDISDEIAYYQFKEGA